MSAKGMPRAHSCTTWGEEEEEEEEGHQGQVGGYPCEGGGEEGEEELGVDSVPQAHQLPGEGGFLLHL